MTVIHFFFH